MGGVWAVVNHIAWTNLLDFVVNIPIGLALDDVVNLWSRVVMRRIGVARFHFQRTKIHILILERGGREIGANQLVIEILRVFIGEPVLAGTAKPFGMDYSHATRRFFLAPFLRL